MSGPYDDIIHLDRPLSKRHRPMERVKRAAQFAPFAALTGYDDCISEASRYVDKPLELDEQALEELNQQLSDALSDPGCHVRFTIFKPDPLKEGGVTEERIGQIKKFDEYTGIITLQSGLKISAQLIRSIEIFKSPEEE